MVLLVTSSKPQLNGNDPAALVLKLLQSFNHWVGYRLQARDERTTKVPINASTGTLASTTDSRTWASFDAAVDAVTRFTLAGVGFVFSTGDPFCGIDLDQAVTEDSRVKPWALDVVGRFPGGYIEYSQSGTGLHIIVEGKAPRNGRRPYHDGAIEIYDRERFFVVTGRPLVGAA